MRTRRRPLAILEPLLLLLSVEEATGQTRAKSNHLQRRQSILEKDASQDDADALTDVVANDDRGGGKVLVEGGRAETKAAPEQTG
mmetsp:Transcript_18323/g.36928  ORF Transcript_18323/g.36928 Transcript_18323/m.36928 type:complete len:85 (-) Transcript_18323:1114-1368(-)